MIVDIYNINSLLNKLNRRDSSPGRGYALSCVGIGGMVLAGVRGGEKVLSNVGYNVLEIVGFTVGIRVISGSILKRIFCKTYNILISDGK